MDMGYTVKHLAVAKLENGMVELRAHPALINLNSHLAKLKGVRNGMEIDTDLIGKITYSRVRSRSRINSIRPDIRFNTFIFLSRYKYFWRTKQ